MHAFLVVGGTTEGRQHYIQNQLTDWHIGPFDAIQLTSDTPTIGVDAVRQIQSRVQTASAGARALVIYHSELLTPEAQNALLKTLEEPPAALRIFLETSSSALLLPTIVSRCQVVLLPPAQTADPSAVDITALLSDSLPVRMKYVQTPLTKEETVAWVDSAIEAARQALLAAYAPSSSAHSDSRAIAHLLRVLVGAQQLLAANSNYILVLDHIAIASGA